MGQTQKASVIILRITAVILLLSMHMSLMGQRTNKRYADYIERYREMAVEQMERYSIPASITLAQGLLESAAGYSTLATEGNNHFGIKCGGMWKGDSMLRDDDAPDECFRVYKSAAESFEDHSKFLTGKRYRPLFELDKSDYAGWARTLRACGYATDPNYADRLITIIELYGLMKYDGVEADHSAAAEYIIGTLRSIHPVRKSRGLHFVVAAPGDTYAVIAKEYGLKTSDLLKYNDREKDVEIKAWEEVYLQPKHKKGPKTVKIATIGEGETMHSLSQRYGMQLSTLKELNPGKADRPGERLRVRD